MNGDPPHGSGESADEGRHPEVPVRQRPLTAPTHAAALTVRLRPAGSRKHRGEAPRERGFPGEGGGSPASVVRTWPWAVIVAVAVAVAIVAGSIGAWTVLRQPVHYRSIAVVEMRRPDLFVDVNPGTITVLNQLRSKYAALVRTDVVVLPAAEELDLPPGVVRRAVGAQVTADSLLFYPFATAATRENAVRIAQEAAEQLVAYAREEQRAAGVPGGEQIELRIVQGAGAPSQVGPDRRRAVIVGIAAALLAGGSVYMALEFGLNRRRTGTGNDRT